MLVTVVSSMTITTTTTSTVKMKASKGRRRRLGGASDAYCGGRRSPRALLTPR